jgi:hypothetical protein
MIKREASDRLELKAKVSPKIVQCLDKSFDCIENKFTFWNFVFQGTCNKWSQIQFDAVFALLKVALLPLNIVNKEAEAGFSIWRLVHVF